MKELKYIVPAVALIVVILFVWINKSTVVKYVDRLVPQDTVTVVDTVLSIDTIVVEKPVVTKTVVTKTVVDTVLSTDSIYVPVVLALESKTYSDSTYKLIVSGYKPQLDYIEVYPKTMTVLKNNTSTVKLKPKKWGIGFTAGYTYGLKSTKLEPTVGIGLYYSIW